MPRIQIKRGLKANLPTSGMLAGEQFYTTDLVLMHDASETTGLKEKKITFDAFKAALNIPPASTDEKVAVVSGGTAGYIWGTDGTDGVIRMGTSMSWTKHASNGYVTIDVGVVDCGTF